MTDGEDTRWVDLHLHTNYSDGADAPVDAPVDEPVDASVGAAVPSGATVDPPVSSSDPDEEQAAPVAPTTKATSTARVLGERTAHPFTAPAVSPEMMYRCRNMNSTSIGNIRMSTAAARAGQSLPYTPSNTIRPRVIGYRSSFDR